MQLTVGGPEFQSFTLDQLDALPQQCGIYAIRNVRTDARYIGKAGGGTVSPRNIARRLREHLGNLHQARGQHRCGKLLADFQAMGPEAFAFEVIELIDKAMPLDHFYAREQHWIDTFDAAAAGYNRVPKAGRGAEGYRHTDDQLQRRMATLAIPEVAARRVASINAGWADSDLRAKTGEKSKAYHADPLVKARHRAGTKAAMARPEERARKGAAAARVQAEKRSLKIAEVRAEIPQLVAAGRHDVARLKAEELTERELVHSLIAGGAAWNSRPVGRACVHAAALARRAAKLLASEPTGAMPRLWRRPHADRVQGAA